MQTTTTKLLELCCSLQHPLDTCSYLPLHLISNILLNNLKFSVELATFSYWLHHAAYGILDPRPGIEPMPPALEAGSFNHGITREVQTLPD